MNSKHVAKYLIIIGVVMLVSAVANFSGGQTVWAGNSVQDPPCIPGTVPCPTPTSVLPTPTAVPSVPTATPSNPEGSNPTPTPVTPPNPGDGDTEPTATVQPALVDNGAITPTTSITSTLISAPTTLPETGSHRNGWWLALLGILSIVAGACLQLVHQETKIG